MWIGITLTGGDSMGRVQISIPVLALQNSATIAHAVIKQSRCDNRYRRLRSDRSMTLSHPASHFYRPLALKTAVYATTAILSVRKLCQNYLTQPFLVIFFSFLVIILFFYFGSCGRLSWLNCQLSSAR